MPYITPAVGANGSVVYALCDSCSQGLTHPVEYQGKVYGHDCFEKVSGLKPENVRKYIRNGKFDQEAMLSDKQRMQEFAVAADLRRKAIAEKNQWLVEALLPYAQFVEGPTCGWDGEPLPEALGFMNAMNFFASICLSLRNGELASELPDRAQRIIADKLSKAVPGGKGYRARVDAEYETVMNKIAETVL